MKLEKPMIVLLAILLSIIYFWILPFSFWIPFPLIRIPHPPITGQIDISPFLNAGCKLNGDNLYCSSIGLEDKFECGLILLAPQYLAGLKVPIVECLYSWYLIPPTYLEKGRYEPRWLGENEYIYKKREVCGSPTFVRYIVFDGEDFILLKTKEEFKNYFLPIDSPEKALSYVAAVTGYYPKYEIPGIGGRYFVMVVEDSYAKKFYDGYIVHLYYYDSCGCGPHPYFTVDYLVSRNGEIKELGTQKIWEDPLGSPCVD